MQKFTRCQVVRSYRLLAAYDVLDEPGCGFGVVECGQFQ
jgi:hypothetical protein